MKNGRTLKRRRKFSKSFKQHIVKEFESKKFSLKELGRLHNIHVSSLYNWVHQYSLNKQPESVIIEMKESSTKKLKSYEEKIKELERIIGQKQIEIDYLGKIIDCANEHYQTDLKKTSSTQRSYGLKRDKVD